MASMEITQEMRARLIRAKDQEEVRAILGPEAAEEEIERVWQEIQHHRPAEGLEAVEDDELEAVSGGADRDYGEQGCAATVEEGSHCWSDDKCNYWAVTYGNYDPCPNGTSESRNHEWELYDDEYFYRCKCKKCGKITSDYKAVSTVKPLSLFSH